MTDDEAKTKFCPIRQPVYPYPPNGSQELNIYIAGRVVSDYGKNQMCLGSECAAWRWLETLQYEMHSGEEGAIVSDKGYCGLAGKP